MRNWRRKREAFDLEAELRENRPRPSDELVSRLEARVHSRPAQAGSFRLAFAGAMAAGVLAALASVGGLGYAATGAGTAVEKAKRVVTKHGVTVVHKSPARDQYAPAAKKVKKVKKAKKKVKKAKKKAAGRRFVRPPFTG